VKVTKRLTGPVGTRVLLRIQGDEYQSTEGDAVTRHFWEKGIGPVELMGGSYQLEVSGGGSGHSRDDRRIDEKQQKTLKLSEDVPQEANSKGAQTSGEKTRPAKELKK